MRSVDLDQLYFEMTGQRMRDFWLNYKGPTASTPPLPRRYRKRYLNRNPFFQLFKQLSTQP